MNQTHCRPARHWRSLATVAGGALLLTGLSACGSDNPSADTSHLPCPTGAERVEPKGSPVVIGADIDTTGPGAAFSIPVKEMLELAVKQLNQCGGVAGRPLKMVVGNDETDATKTPTVLRQLADQGSKFLLLQTGVIESGKSTIEKLGIPTIAPTSVSTAIATPPDAAYGYVLANPISDWSQVFCSAFEKTGVSTLALLSDDTPSIASLNGYLLPLLKDCVDIVAEESGKSDASDLNAQVARLKAKKPDAVLVSSVGGSFEILAHNTLFEQLPETQRFSLATIVNQPDTWKLANAGALEGVVGMGSINPENEQTRDLAKLLEVIKGNGYQPTAYEAQAYDSIGLVKAAIERAKSEDATKVNEALESITDFKSSTGAPGYVLGFSTTDHVGSSGLCGIVLQEFDDNNEPTKAWDKFQPTC